MGMEPDRLYRFDLQGGDGNCRMRVILLRTGKTVGRPLDEQEMAFSWGDVLGRKADARQAAARACLAELLEGPTYHANFMDVPVHSILPGTAGGGAPFRRRH